MANEHEPNTLRPDSAAVFAGGVSIWEAAHKHAAAEHINLSELYNGVDQLMREVMRIATLFEEWACRHVSFDALSDVWPYLLEDRFGETCLDVMMIGALTEFDATDCLRVALRMRLPIKLDEGLPIPVDERAENPVPGSEFRQFRIQTVRSSMEDNEVLPFTVSDEPFDPELGQPYFGIYGVRAEGLVEHIADRSTYGEAVTLVSKLAPGVDFPRSPVTHAD